MIINHSMGFIYLCETKIVRQLLECSMHFECLINSSISTISYVKLYVFKPSLKTKACISVYLRSQV